MKRRPTNSEYTWKKVGDARVLMDQTDRRAEREDAEIKSGELHDSIAGRTEEEIADEINHKRILEEYHSERQAKDKINELRRSLGLPPKPDKE